MARRSVPFSKFDPDRDINSNWETADEISWAWLNYGPPELQDAYRDSGRNEHRSAALKFELQTLLKDRIAHNEVLAFGIESSSSTTEASRIPVILFKSKNVKINWDSDELVGLGRKFEDVKVCLLDRPTPVPEPVELPNRRKPTNAPEPSKGKRGGGRASLYPQARQVLQELYEEHPGYRTFSAARLIHAFNERYLAKFTPPGESSAPVSDRALRNYIDEYRQELASTGKNQNKSD